MNLDLTDEETATLLRELDGLINGDRYFMSQRIKTLKSHHPLPFPIHLNAKAVIQAVSSVRIIRRLTSRCKIQRLTSRCKIQRLTSHPIRRLTSRCKIRR